MSPDRIKGSAWSGPTHDQPRIFTARYLMPILGNLIEDGALALQSGRITAVGRRDAVCSHAPNASCTDFGEAILLPPLINAHTHLELTGFPDWTSALGVSRRAATFVEWMLELIRIKRSVPLEAFLPSLKDGIHRSLAAGTGAVGDIVSYLPARQAYAGSPLRGRVFLEILGRDPGRWWPLLETIGQVLDEDWGGPTILGLSPHAPYTLSEECLQAVSALARRRHLALTIHLAESTAEEAFLREAGGPLVERLYPGVGWADMVPPAAGLSPVAYLARSGGLQPGSLLIHAVHVSAADAGQIAAAGASVVLCPRSNANLGVGRAPVETYLAAGINLALGTDSLASNDSLSVWDEIAFARTWFAPALDPGTLLTMATLGGARALGLVGEMGALVPGWGAHFQVLGLGHLPAAGGLCEALCDGSGRTVRQLFLGGEETLHRGG